jgi:hypothetical protein
MRGILADPLAFNNIIDNVNTLYVLSLSLINNLLFSLSVGGASEENFQEYLAELGSYLSHRQK